MNKKERFEKAMDKLDNMSKQEFIKLLRDSGDTRDYTFTLSSDGIPPKTLSFFAASNRPRTTKVNLEQLEDKNIFLPFSEMSEEMFSKHFKNKGKTNE